MSISKGIKSIGVAAVALLTLGLSACTTSQADIASENLSKEADELRVNRRIVFLNGITDSYMLVIEGRCSIEADNVDSQLEVTCATGEGTFKKHFLGLSDNVSYFVEQLEGVAVSTYRYKVYFKPTTIVPDVEVDLGK